MSTLAGFAFGVACGALGIAAAWWLWLCEARRPLERDPIDLERWHARTVELWRAEGKIPRRNTWTEQEIKS